MSLWFFKFSNFFLSFFVHGCIMNSGCFCFFIFFNRSLSRFVVSCVFIKCHIPIDFNILVSWEIYSVSPQASEYPTNIPFFPEGSNFVLFSFGMCMYTGQPNILRWLTYGFLPEKTSLGVLFLSTLCGVWFCTYTTILATSAQICIGRS